MKKIRVHLKTRSYNILIGRRLLERCGTFLKRLDIGKDAVIITNVRLSKLYRKSVERSMESAGLSARFELIPDSEKAKSNRVAANMINRISAYDKGKDIFIVAFGGGVVGDVAGFVAAVYKRGIPYVQVPTTLLAQVDSAIGGKVAIDLPLAKNLIGAFYQPKLVVSDITLLKSLSRRQMRNGLAEIIKYGVIKDEKLFGYLEKNCGKILMGDDAALEFLIARSSAIKAKVVEKDEFDKKGSRAVLNYGHTIGHAIEAASGYSKRYSHGEAIAVGMVGAARIASRLGLMDRRDVVRIESLIERAGLPMTLEGIGISDIYEALLHDKKSLHGVNRFILPARIGSVRVVKGVPVGVIKDILEGLFQR